LCRSKTQSRSLATRFNPLNWREHARQSAHKTGDREPPAIADSLDLDYDELMKLKTADKIQKDYGKIPLELAGKNAELDPIDRVWK